jgi:hypothetical protein
MSSKEPWLSSLATTPSRISRVVGLRRPFRYACNSLAAFPAVNWRAAASRKSQQKAIMMQF